MPYLYVVTVYPELRFLDGSVVVVTCDDGRGTDDAVIFGVDWKKSVFGHARSRCASCDERGPYPGGNCLGERAAGHYRTYDNEVYDYTVRPNLSV